MLTLNLIDRVLVHGLRVVATMKSHAGISVGLFFFSNQLYAGVFANGDFEVPSFAEGVYSATTGGVDAGLLSPWSFGGNPAAGVSLVSGGNILFNSGFPSSGNQFLNFNGGDLPPGSTVEQTFDTIVGITYKIQFDVGRHGIAAQNIGLRGEALSGTGSLLAVVEEHPLDYGYMPRTTLLFEAVSTESIVRFTDISVDTSSVDILLDNVSITAVPEPEQVGLLASTLLVGMVFLRRNSLKSVS